jgi:hypothetical protein
LPSTISDGGALGPAPVVASALLLNKGDRKEFGVVRAKRVRQIQDAGLRPPGSGGATSFFLFGSFMEPALSVQPCPANERGGTKKKKNIF